MARVIFSWLSRYSSLMLVLPSQVFFCRRFHVDKMSSAHVYVRLRKGQGIDDMSEGLLEDCAQLVKANSIQGNCCIDVLSSTCS